MAGSTWRYWRLYITEVQSGTFASIQDFVVSDTAGGASIFTGGTASSSSDYSATYNAAKAFDGNNANYWYSATGSSLPQWIKYDVGSSVRGRYLELRPYTVSSGSNIVADASSPKTFTLQGSDDNSTWTTLLSITGTNWSVYDKWAVAANQIRIPFGWKAAGNSKQSNNDPATKVFAFKWPNAAFIYDVVTPDSSGDWEIRAGLLSTDQIGIVHVPADSGYRPLVDGPITPDAAT